MKRLLTRAEVVRVYGLGRRFLELSAGRGGGPPFVKAGGRALYDRLDLERWIASRRRRSTSDPGPTPEEAERLARERLAEAGGTGGGG